MKIRSALLMVAASLPASTVASAADVNTRVQNAIAEARKAQAAPTLEATYTHLRRAENCLVGRDSGYYYAPNGDTGPCTDRAPVWEEAQGFARKSKLQDAETMLGAGRNQSDLMAAHDHAEDAIKLMQAAMAAGADD